MNNSADGGRKDLEYPMDGFTLDTRVRIMPMLAPALCLGQIDTLRRARNYRPRWFSTPHNSDSGMPTLGARASYEEQIQLEPGSWWWGWKVNNPAVLAFQVTEEETGRKFCVDLQTPSYLTQAPNTWFCPNLLASPWLILSPGLLNLEVHSTSNSQQTVQLVLMFAEPVCAIERSVDPCRM